LKASDALIEADEAQCNRTSTGFVCLVPLGADAIITVSGYHKANTTLYACHFGDVLDPRASQQAPNDNWAVFGLPLYNASDADIVIQSDPCN
jgi:hypothetical protein